MDINFTDLDQALHDICQAADVDFYSTAGEVHSFVLKLIATKALKPEGIAAELLSGDRTSLDRDFVMAVLNSERLEYDGGEFVDAGDGIICHAHYDSPHCRFYYASSGEWAQDFEP